MTELAASLTFRLSRPPISMASMGASAAVVADACNEIWLFDGDEQPTHVNFGDPSVDRLRTVIAHRTNHMLVAGSGRRIQALLPDHEGWTWTFESGATFGMALESGSIDMDPSGRIVACFDDGTFGLWSRGGVKLISGFSDVPYRQAAFVDHGVRVALNTGFALDVWNTRTGSLDRIKTWSRRTLQMSSAPERGWIAIRLPDRIQVVDSLGCHVFDVPAKCSAVAPRFIGDGQRIGVPEGKSVILYDVESGQAEAHHRFPANVMCLSAHGQGLLVGLADGAIYNLQLDYR